MRITALVLAIAATLAAGTAPALAEEPLGIVRVQDIKPYTLHTLIRLDTLDALRQLRNSNPRHYAIARKILAAANEICESQKGAPLRMRFDAQHVACMSSFWMTSNPPKRELSFLIDDVPYAALVEVRNLGAKLEPVDPAWGQGPTAQPRR